MDHMNLTYDIIYSLTMLVVLPTLIIYTRVILTKNLTDRSFAKTLIMELPHDLSIMGMTLGFSAFALIREEVTHEQTATIFLIVPFVPFLFFTAIYLIVPEIRRFIIDLLAYLTGVSIFLLVLYWRYL